MTVSHTVEHPHGDRFRARVLRGAARAEPFLVPAASALVAAVALTGGVRPTVLAAVPAALAALAAPRVPRRLGSGLLLLLALAAGGSGAILGSELLVAAGVVYAVAGARAGWGVNRGLRRRRAWSYRLLTVLAALPLLLYVAVPVLQSVNYVGKPRQPIADAALGLPHETVAFAAADGVRLAGWFVPGRTDAAVVVVHGGGGDREGAVRHARLLSSLGYAVLVYDARGRGESGGSHNAFGWEWHHDVRGAVDHLERRGFGRIAALGLSTGAEAVVTAAASDPRIAAVVADGIQGRRFADTKYLTGIEGLLLRPAMAAGELGVRLASGESPAPPLLGLVHRVAATRPLLLVAGPSFEADWNRAYAKGTSATVWAPPGTAHTAALREHPDEYRARVARLLDPALG